MSEPHNTPTIRLGLLAPLTGVVDMYGSEISQAAQIACQEINAKGGLLGCWLELVIEDDGSLPHTALPAALKLVDEYQCVAIIGNLLSNSRIAVANQVALSRQIPMLNFSFYEGSIANRYFFHFAALPNQQIDKMIPYMAEHYGPKMFFAGNNYEWPRGSIDAAKIALRHIGGDVVGEEYLAIGAGIAAIDYLLEAVLRSGADVFVPYFAGFDQIMLLTRFTELGMKKRMAVVMGHYDEMMVSRLPPAVRAGFYSSNTYFMSVDTEQNRHYLNLLKQQPGISGIWPSGNGILTNFGEGAYICVHAFAKAAAQAGSTDAESLIEALENVEVSAPQGVVTMDAATHHASINGYLARCNANGTFSIIERFGCHPPVIPERYRPEFDPDALHLSPILSNEQQTTTRRQTMTGQIARQMLSLADMAIIATDEQGIISDVNRSACLMFGYREDEMLGMSVHLLLPPNFRHRHADMIKQFVEGQETERRMSKRGSIMGYRKDGSFFPLEAGIAKFHNENSWMLVVTMIDITERQRVEQELLWRASHDVLTGLPNRDLIQERLVAALQRSRRLGLCLALLFIDLDEFKSINDTHGHEAGDQLLQVVSARLLEQARPGDTVARLAGDEFVVLCEQLEHPTAISALAERINDALRQVIDIGDKHLFVTASIGIAIGSGSSHSADDLLRSADIAMYAVKEKGRDGWHFFNEGLQQQAQQRLSIIQGLRQAIEHGELSANFQPIVEIESGHIVGAELLLRWHPPEGEISPALFIPVAETNSTIVTIGLWVFRVGCLTEVEWRERWGETAPYISINMSARHLNEASVVDDFAAILYETAADAGRIVLEITETSLMADVESNLRTLRRLAHLGMKIAIDDFGTGYSSLAQLTRMPVHVLKIDKAFVDGIEKQPESRTLIRAVIGMGRAMGMKLLAEGVETEIQRHELAQSGCDLIQGYFFYRPLDAKTFIELMDKRLAGACE